MRLFFCSFLFSTLLLRGLCWLVRIVLRHTGYISVVSDILLSASWNLLEILLALRQGRRYFKPTSISLGPRLSRLVCPYRRSSLISTRRAYSSLRWSFFSHLYLLNVWLWLSALGNILAELLGSLEIPLLLGVSKVKIVLLLNLLL